MISITRKTARIPYEVGFSFRHTTRVTSTRARGICMFHIHPDVRDVRPKACCFFIGGTLWNVESVRAGVMRYRKAEKR